MLHDFSLRIIGAVLTWLVGTLVEHHFGVDVINDFARRPFPGAVKI